MLTQHCVVECVSASPSLQGVFKTEREKTQCVVEFATTAVDPLHLVNSPPSESAFPHPPLISTLSLDLDFTRITSW